VRKVILLKQFDYQKAARVLVDAVAHGDRHAADKWQVSQRTVANYRQRLIDDELFAQVFRAQSHSASGWHAARREALETVYVRIKEMATDKGFDYQQFKVLSVFAQQSGDLEMNHEMNLEEKGLEDAPAVLARIGATAEIADEEEEQDDDVSSELPRKKRATKEPPREA